MYHHYPAVIRLWHLLNGLFFLLLILTGLNMQFASPDHPFIALPESVNIHRICGVGVTINYFLFIIGNIISGNGKHYLIRFRGLLKNIFLQSKYYLLKSWENPEPPFPVTSDRKFNPLQALAYTKVMYIAVPLLIITGLGLLFPELVFEKIFGLGGLLVTDLVHVALGFLLTVFLVIHIYMCTLGKTPASSFRAIITGWQQGEKD